MARLYLDELADKHAKGRADKLAVIEDCCWGEASAVLYALAFVPMTHRTTLRILVEGYADHADANAEGCADQLRDIARFAGELADEWDEVSESVDAKRGA